MFDERPKTVSVSDNKNGMTGTQIGDDAVVPVGKHAVDDIGETFRSRQDIGWK